MSGIQYAGEFSVKEIKILTSSGNVIDVKNNVLALELFEEITAPSMTGTMTIVDVDNILENAPIVGQEFLVLKIETPSLEEEAFDFTENVFSIHKVLTKDDVTENTQVFSISFCSTELIRNSRVRVSKSYNDTISNMVRNILTDTRFIDTRKKLFVEETNGIRSLISPNLRPFDFIHNLKQEALSKKFNAPHFFFYENTKGIHFKSLQSIFASNTIANFNTGNLQRFEEGQVKSDEEAEFQRVLKYQINSNSDMLFNTRAGMLGSKVTEYNIYNKSFNVTRYNYFENFEDFPRINGNPIYNNTIIDEQNNTVGSFSDAKIHLHPTSSSGTNDTSNTNADSFYQYTKNQIAQGLLQRQAKLTELKNGINLTMYITGNTTISAGEMINLQIPITGRVHNKEFDKKLSGDYLITELRHIFSIPDKKHEIALTIVKDSLPEELETIQSAIEPKPQKALDDEINYT
tara:strand:- start:372 stop:1754 length:1383 start_codon:yes stop_codon:yes gene_type:complete